VLHSLCGVTLMTALFSLISIAQAKQIPLTSSNKSDKWL